jgi:hypothetical protein
MFQNVLALFGSSSVDIIPYHANILWSGSKVVPERYMGGVEVSLHPFLTSSLGGESQNTGTWCTDFGLGCVSEVLVVCSAVVLYLLYEMPSVSVRWCARRRTGTNSPS